MKWNWLLYFSFGFVFLLSSCSSTQKTVKVREEVESSLNVLTVSKDAKTPDFAQPQDGVYTNPTERLKYPTIELDSTEILEVIELVIGGSQTRLITPDEQITYNTPKEGETLKIERNTGQLGDTTRYTVATLSGDPEDIVITAVVDTSDTCGTLCELKWILVFGVIGLVVIGGTVAFVVYKKSEAASNMVGKGVEALTAGLIKLGKK